VQEQEPPTAKRAPKDDSTRPTDRIALGSVLAGALLVALIVGARLTFFSGGDVQVNTAALGLNGTSQPATGSPAATAAPSAQAAAGTASVTPTSQNTQIAHVANTEGQGVVLRASPRDDDRTPRGFLEGDRVTVLERSGPDWARVRGDNGQEGWVPTRYLGP
jgi:hypothetical protein